MKNFFKIFLVLFFGLFSNIQAYGCDALNIEIGTKISKITNYLDFIQEDQLIELNNLDDEDKEDFESTFKFRGMTEQYCPKMGLENTSISIFVYDLKVAGIQLETWDPNIKKNKIYEYVKNNIGGEIEKIVEEDDNWVGHQDLSTGGRVIYYTKYKDYGEIYELLDISNEEYVDFTLQEEVEEMIF
tara:strand:- start:203 stop:760 length:558 start_codon:yes stop_codon:yes gene_type:complete